MKVRMKRFRGTRLWFWLAAFCCSVSAPSRAAPPASLSETGAVQRASISTNANQRVKLIAASISNKVASVKQFTASMDSQFLDPNGGFDKFADELTFRAPDKLRLSRKVLQAHNDDMVGQKITTVVDGAWMLSRMESAAHDQDRPRILYSKVNLKTVEKEGGISVREQLAYIGNLADPFTPYQQDTLKLVAETETNWVLLAKYKETGAPWQTNRLTIEKATGILKKLEALIPEMDEPVVLVEVRKISLEAEVPDSIFEMDLPSSGVQDNTSQWLENLKEKRR